VVDVAELVAVNFIKKMLYRSLVIHQLAIDAAISHEQRCILDCRYCRGGKDNVEILNL